MPRSLKPEIVKGLDIMIVRELTGGVYFGEPRGIDTLRQRRASRRSTRSVYTTGEIRRVCARRLRAGAQAQEQGLLVEKANVMQTGVLWREEVTKLHKDEVFATWSSATCTPTNCAMQLVRSPKQFDVIVTDNLFGDILSD